MLDFWWESQVLNNRYYYYALNWGSDVTKFSMKESVCFLFGAMVSARENNQG